LLGNSAKNGLKKTAALIRARLLSGNNCQLFSLGDKYVLPPERMKKTPDETNKTFLGRV